MPDRGLDPLTESRCRHCGEPIHMTNWIHEHGLNRCQGNVPQYGYDAMPDTGKPCSCWACERYGPTSVQ